MSTLTLTIEDLLAAARCVAQWRRVGARPFAVARHLRDAAQRAAQYRQRTGQINPRLGDGSVMAAAVALVPYKRNSAAPVTMPELTAALGPVCLVFSNNGA